MGKRTNLVQALKTLGMMETTLTYLVNYLPDNIHQMPNKTVRSLFMDLNRTCLNTLEILREKKQNELKALLETLANERRLISITLLIPNSVFRITRVSGWFQKAKVLAELNTILRSVTYIRRVLVEN